MNSGDFGCEGARLGHSGANSKGDRGPKVSDGEEIGRLALELHEHGSSVHMVR